jgi:hypothetical protein
LDNILNGGDGIEYYLYHILFNSVASTIPKWRIFKLLRLVQILNRLVDLDEIFYGDYDIEGFLDSIILNLVASNVPKWGAFKLL